MPLAELRHPIRDPQHARTSGKLCTREEVLDHHPLVDSGPPLEPIISEADDEGVALYLGLAGCRTIRLAFGSRPVRPHIAHLDDPVGEGNGPLPHELKRRVFLRILRELAIAFGVLWFDGPHAGWDAYDRVLQREVVLNVAYRLTDAPRLVEKARTLARLQHANILPLLDLGITGEGLPFFTKAKMDWQKWQPLDSIGERLAERGAAAGPDPVQPLIGGVRDVCRAVNHARSRGIVNSDLYPGCILFGSDLRDVLVVEEWERIRDEDATGEGCGRAALRLPYASPEQVRKLSALISPAVLFLLFRFYCYDLP